MAAAAASVPMWFIEQCPMHEECSTRSWKLCGSCKSWESEEDQCNIIHMISERDIAHNNQRCHNL